MNWTLSSVGGNSCDLRFCQRREHLLSAIHEHQRDSKNRLSHCQDLLVNGPSKTLSEILRRSLGLSRACNFSGSNSFGPSLPTAAIASTWKSSGIRSSL